MGEKNIDLEFYWCVKKKFLCWLFSKVNMSFKLIMGVILRKNVYFTYSKKLVLVVYGYSGEFSWSIFVV
jgi:hypothetical protein